MIHAKEYYDEELAALMRSKRIRTRKLSNQGLIDMGSNDYLGLGGKQKLFKKAYRLVLEYKSYAPKSSLFVNGYHLIHKLFEDRLCELNHFESGIVVGSGFLANIALIEGLVRKKDTLFIDEEYHASGILASKLIENVVFFRHNDSIDLEEKLRTTHGGRKIVAIEGVYSMGGDIAPKEIGEIADRYDAILIVDEAHSSGVIGENLLGWYDFHHYPIKKNHIKMGTLGKAYGSYGAYILGSSHIISYLENRAKSLIYTTAPSLFDVAFGYVALEYIVKNKEKLVRKIAKKQQLVRKYFGIETQSLILPIPIGSNEQVLRIQKNLQEEKGIMVGAIRTPTVASAILRIILKLDTNNKVIKQIAGHRKRTQWEKKTPFLGIN